MDPSEEVESTEEVKSAESEMRGALKHMRQIRQQLDPRKQQQAQNRRDTDPTMVEVERTKEPSTCSGPNATYVKLISSDGHEFVIPKKYVTTSNTIKAMLSGPGQYTENEQNEVTFREISSHVLRKVCFYFMYKVRYTNSATEIPEFSIAPEVAIELLMASNFLDC